MAAGELFILHSDKKLVKGVFGGADHESATTFWKFEKFKMVDQIWRSENFSCNIPMKNWVKGIETLITNFLSDFENFENLKRYM